jgi:hypothetical protein
MDNALITKPEELRCLKMAIFLAPRCLIAFLLYPQRILGFLQF